MGVPNTNTPHGLLIPVPESRAKEPTLWSARCVGVDAIKEPRPLVC